MSDDRLVALEVAVDALAARFNKLEARSVVYIAIGSFLGGMVAQWAQ